MKKFFLYGFLILTLLGGCATAIEKAGKKDDRPVVQATSEAGNSVSNSEIMQACLDLVATKPGDVIFIEKFGWKLVCSESGDPALDASGDLETMGYTDFDKKEIFLDAMLVNDAVIVHEAAHALDFIAFDELMQKAMAMKLGEDDWYESDSYWMTPAEIFAESRAGCLGYTVDPDFKTMSCELIDSMISDSYYAEDIKYLVKAAKL